MRIFIGSTCHDLIDLRAELEPFFREAGVSAILSDSLTSEFQAMPDRNSIEACLANLRSCDEVLVILSNRYGPSLTSAGYPDVSATHLEYREAVARGIRIRMFVRDRLEADYNIWRKNEDKQNLELIWCKDRKDWKLFELIDEHRPLRAGAGQTNWFWTFRNSFELKQRLEIEFREAFARVTAVRLFENGRLPYFEIFPLIQGLTGKEVRFSLKMRNLGRAIAVAPVLQLDGPSNRWPLQSMGEQQAVELSILWSFLQGTTTTLSTQLTYSILEGHDLLDEGTLSITPAQQPSQGIPYHIQYEPGRRIYVRPTPGMALS
jgi:hypothetical protein